MMSLATLDMVKRSKQIKIEKLLNNIAPVFTSSATASVAENTATAITIVATDEQTITYSISGTDAADFSINSSTGVVSFNPVPDYESPADSDTNNIYIFTATATDAKGLATTQNIEIIVTNAEQGVSASQSSLTVGEAGTNTYTLVLNDAPTADVVVTPTSNNTNAATVSSALTFTMANWATPQTVTVTGVNDANTINESVTISHSAANSLDAGYKAVSIASVAVTLADDDAVAGITQSATSATIGEASTGTYTVVLNTQPTGDVTITPVSSDTGAATVSGVMTFTTGNWNTA
ncbi:cadherin repeat domain-containing protein, partial [Bathymodiolus heckerae thiotrophic gill symbiont]|uniref:cadherin repeat domain-containing protein n=1 Tax=Bathymodiolus heckerae thiotrophic gill symbiont TaxID=1052212 RepID=UPI003D18A5F9